MRFSYIGTYIFYVILRSFATSITRPRLFQYFMKKSRHCSEVDGECVKVDQV